MTYSQLASAPESSWKLSRFRPERWEKAFNGTGDYPVPGEDVGVSAISCIILSFWYGSI